jgi:hypothetical protein
MSDNLNTEREVKSVWRAQGTWVPVDGGLVHAYPGARFLRAQVRDARVLVVALDFGPAERPNAEEVEYAVKFVRVNEEIKEPSPHIFDTFEFDGSLYVATVTAPELLR